MLEKEPAYETRFFNQHPIYTYNSVHNLNVSSAIVSGNYIMNNNMEGLRSPFDEPQNTKDTRYRKIQITEIILHGLRGGGRKPVTHSKKLQTKNTTLKISKIKPQ
jgi:hypothetical protein